MCSLRFTIMRRRLGLGLALAAVLSTIGCNPDGQDPARSESSSDHGAASATSSATQAPASSGSAGILDASWVAPTTNADGSPLTDLAFDRLYFGTASTPCSSSAFFQVASPTTTPQVNDLITYRVTGLIAGAQYFASVTAVDSSGVESDCSPMASAIARSASGLAAGALGTIADMGDSVGGTVTMQRPVATLPGMPEDARTQARGETVDLTPAAAGGAVSHEHLAR